MRVKGCTLEQRSLGAALVALTLHRLFTSCHAACLRSLVPLLFHGCTRENVQVCACVDAARVLVCCKRTCVLSFFFKASTRPAHFHSLETLSTHTLTLTHNAFTFFHPPPVVFIFCSTLCALCVSISSRAAQRACARACLHT